MECVVPFDIDKKNLGSNKQQQHRVLSQEGKFSLFFSKTTMTTKIEEEAQKKGV